MNETASQISRSKVTALQITKIGNSVGVILPKELLARLNLKEGDKLLSGRAAGRQLAAVAVRSEACSEGDGNRPARSCSEYRDTLAALAK